MINIIKEYINSSLETKQKILDDNEILQKVEKISKLIVNALQNDNKILFVGNGGSASDCDHLATEFVSKFYKDRHAFNAISLTSNNALITALSNDFGYDNAFSRQIEALGRKEDIFIALSTSGNSENIVKALEVAKQKGCITIGFTGENTCKIEGLCDYIFKIPTQSVPQIQETYMMICHIICAIVEKHFS